MVRCDSRRRYYNRPRQPRPSLAFPMGAKNPLRCRDCGGVGAWEVGQSQGLSPTYRQIEGRAVTKEPTAPERR